MSRARFLVVLLLLVSGLGGPAQPAGAQPAAAPPGAPAVPEPLKPWVPWVLAGHPDLPCPLVAGKRLCAWPGRLDLDLGDAGGTFTLEVTADRDLDLTLPGDGAHWPGEVTDGGRPALLRRSGELPAVALGAGRHRLAGRFRWSRLPESLPVPPEVALVTLSLRGRSVPAPRREESGLVWLGGGQAEEAEEERVAVEVSRRIDDGVPVGLTVHLALRVSGRPREVTLGQPLPPGFAPTALAGGVPVRLVAGRDGGGPSLVAQLRPGDWEVTLEARSLGPVTELACAAQPAPWPAEEFWVFAADPAVRSVRLEGAAAVDPGRTPLPAAWRDLPAFRLTPGQSLALVELRRGQAAPPPDELRAERRWWLSEDGALITAQDSLTGTLHAGGRLEALAPADLGRVSLAGAGGDEVITLGPDGGRPGVEVRDESLALTAELTYPRGGALPAAGWNRDLRGLAVELNLPPGWTLVAAPGADRAEGAWVDAWTLLDLFFLLLIALATWKLYGWRWGALALVSFGLAWHEPHAGWLAAWWLALLPLLALLRLLGRGRLGRWLGRLRWVVAAALCLELFVFAASQWRIGLHPQLAAASFIGPEGAPLGFENPGAFTALGYLGGRNAPEGKFVGGAMEEQRLQMQGGAIDQARQMAPPSRPLPESLGKGENAAPGERARQVDVAAVSQTGPGVPRWGWRQCALSWTGPVAADHRLRLLLVGPGLAVLLALLRIAGVVLLAFCLLDPRRNAGGGGLHPAEVEEGPSSPAEGGEDGGAAAEPRPEISLDGETEPGPGTSPDGKAEPGSEASPGGGAGTVVLLAFLVLHAAAAPAAAQEEAPAPAEPSSSTAPAAPRGDLLGELERRLTAPPPCAPDCVEVPHLLLAADAAGIRIEAEVHAAAPAAWALPGPAAAWTPARVTVDGEAVAALRRSDEGFLLLRLPPGIHRVELAGPAGETVTLQLPLPPRAMEWRGEGWTLSGFRPDVAPPASVRLDRRVPAAGGEAAGGEIAPWLELTRDLDLGIPWLVHNELRRFGPPGVPVTARVPLLPGESVTTAGVEVAGGEAAITLERGETVRRWRSTLAEAPALTLTAPADRPWIERWILTCSPLWSCASEGLAPIRHVEEGRARPQWQPWPGESVTFHFVRPEAAPGATTTLDAVHLAVTPGRRLLEGKLTVELRASRAGEETLTLPSEATLQSFAVDGRPQPVDAAGGRIRLPVEPGSHRVEAAWRQPHALGLGERVPAVALGSPAANVSIELAVPENRWLLWAGGPRWGSVVTLWLYLPVLALAAWALGRWAPTPLGAADWLLLGVGLSQVPLLAAAVVPLWLLLFGLRERYGSHRRWVRRLLQVALGLLWLAALVVLYFAVQAGLLGQPDMQLAGPGAGQLAWYADRIAGPLPRPYALWFPLWVFRVLMLLWALWLSARLLRWLPWAWQRLAAGGGTPAPASPPPMRP
jgi:hypothetical protein